MNCPTECRQWGTWAWVFLLPKALPSYSEESGPKISHRRHLSRLSSQVNYSRPRKRNRIQCLGVSNTPGIKPQNGWSGSPSCLRCRRATSWLPLKVDQTLALYSEWCIFSTRRSGMTWLKTISLFMSVKPGRKTSNSSTSLIWVACFQLYPESDCTFNNLIT